MIAMIVSQLLAGMIQDRFEAEIKAFERADAAMPPIAGGIVFVGSSSIRLWETLRADFPAYNVINRGFGGSHLSESVQYAKRIVTPYKPKIVVLFAGTNDIADGKAPKTVAGDYASFVRTVRAELPDVKIVYISITPAPSRWDKLAEIRQANTLIAEHVQKDKNQRFVNTFDRMLSPQGGPRPELFVEDRLHLNIRGYALWKSELAPVLSELTGASSEKAD